VFDLVPFKCAVETPGLAAEISPPTGQTSGRIGGHLAFGSPDNS
jgi:hypothetical protein